MVRRFITTLVCAMLAVGGTLSPARASDLVYASGPAGQNAGYTVPVMVMQVGDTIKYVNVDIAQHDVRSVAMGADRPWCDVFPFNFGAGTCPLFTSALLGLGGSGPVYGLEDVLAGEIYDFYCSIHGGMKGKLVVLPV